MWKEGYDGGKENKEDDSICIKSLMAEGPGILDILTPHLDCWLKEQSLTHSNRFYFDSARIQAKELYYSIY